MKTRTRRLSSRKLTFTFLAIIMAMSILFSTVFYSTSVHELEKRPTADIHGTYLSDPDHELDEWIGSHSEDSKMALGQRLIILNIFALILGAIVSYLLARIALKPIERALNEQDQFISDASHELRTPITASLLSNEVALKNKSLTLSDAKSVLADNVADMQELKNLSDELLNQSQAVHIHEQKRTISFQQFITTVLSSTKKVADDKNIEIVCVVEKDTVELYTKTLKKVLVIILDNAIKYSPTHSTIQISGVVHTNEVIIKIKDEGIGISRTDQNYIFDRFYRSDLSRSKYEGYGLGLSIAKKLVVEMGGTIKVSSKIDSGSEFIVKLPRK